MVTLTTAYTLAWIVIGTYLMWLGSRGRQLSRRLDFLESTRKAAGADRQRSEAA